MKTRKPYKSKYSKIYNKISKMEVGDKIFVQFEYLGSSYKFQQALHFWCKTKFPDKKYKTFRYGYKDPLILQVLRIE